MLLSLQIFALRDVCPQYRNKMNEQQNQVVSQQRQALAQRQAEMASIDARIAQLQSRLQRKRALNQRLTHQLNSGGGGGGGTGGRCIVGGTNNPGFSDTKLDGFGKDIVGGKLRPAGNIAAIEPYSHIPNDNDFNLNKNDPKYQTLPYNTKFTVNFKAIEDDVNKNKIQHSASASQLGQRPAFQQYGHQIAHSQSQSHIQGEYSWLEFDIDCFDFDVTLFYDFLTNLELISLGKYRSFQTFRIVHRLNWEFILSEYIRVAGIYF